jgi:hypothetical protein
VMGRSCDVRRAGGMNGVSVSGFVGEARAWQGMPLC